MGPRRPKQPRERWSLAPSLVFIDVKIKLPSFQRAGAVSLRVQAIFPRVSSSSCQVSRGDLVYHPDNCLTTTNEQLAYTRPPTRLRASAVTDNKTAARGTTHSRPSFPPPIGYFYHASQRRSGRRMGTLVGVAEGGEARRASARPLVGLAWGGAATFQEPPPLR